MQDQVKKQVKDVITIKTSTMSLKDECTIKKNFIPKIKNQTYITIYYYADLKVNHKNMIQLNQLITEFVETNRTELKVVIECIVKD